MKAPAMLFVLMLASAAIAADLPDPRVDFQRAVELLKNKKYDDFCKRFLVKSEYEELQEAMQSEPDKKEFFAEFTQKEMGRLITINKWIMHSEPQYFEEDGFKIAFLRARPDVTGTMGILLLYEGKTWRFRHSSQVKSPAYADLKKRGLVKEVANTFADKLEAEHAKAINELGKSFVSALKAEDFGKCASLWLTPAQMLDLLKTLPEGLRAPTSKKELERFEQYGKDRDEHNRKEFPQIVASLKKRGFGLATIEHVNTEPHFESDYGVTGATMFTVRLKDAEGHAAAVMIDDGLFVDGKWYFTDKILGFRP